MTRTRRANVCLPEVHKGRLLAEVVRAFLHSGNPSAMFANIARGMDEYMAECNSKEWSNMVDGIRRNVLELQDASLRKENEQT